MSFELEINITEFLRTNLLTIWLTLRFAVHVEKNIHSSHSHLSGNHLSHAGCTLPPYSLLLAIHHRSYTGMGSFERNKVGCQSHQPLSSVGNERLRSRSQKARAQKTLNTSHTNHITALWFVKPFGHLSFFLPKKYGRFSNQKNS